MVKNKYLILETKVKVFFLSFFLIENKGSNL